MSEPLTKDNDVIPMAEFERGWPYPINHIIGNKVTLIVSILLLFTLYVFIVITLSKFYGFAFGFCDSRGMKWVDDNILDKSFSCKDIDGNVYKHKITVRLLPWY